MWDVVLHAAFAREAKQYSRAVQVEIAALIGLLQQFGPQLKRPHCDTLNGFGHANVKELRFRVADGVWRMAFAFDPTRQAIILVAGSKSGVSEKQFIAT